MPIQNVNIVRCRYWVHKNSPFGKNDVAEMAGRSEDIHGIENKKKEGMLFKALRTGPLEI